MRGLTEMTGDEMTTKFFSLGSSSGSSTGITNPTIMGSGTTSGTIWESRTASHTSPPSVEQLVESETSSLPDTGMSEDGTVYLKIIRPGWGNKYYSEKLLRESASRYPAGTKMFWNHASTREMKERPERDLRDLAAVFTEGAQYNPSGPKGPGLYVHAKVFAPYRESLKELWPYIGTSHCGFGKVRIGEAEGRRGLIAESIDKIESVDFVTTPGAGGEIVKMFESMRGRNHADLEDSAEDTGTFMAPTLESLKTEAPELITQIRESALAGITVQDIPASVMTALKEAFTQELAETAEAQEKKRLHEATVTENKELKAQIARMQEAQAISEAKAIVTEKLSGSGLIEASKVRIAESLVSQIKMTDGVLDVAAYTTLVESTIASEKSYLDAVLKESGPARQSGSVTGMGTSDAGSQAQIKESKVDRVSLFMDMGMTEAEAKAAAGV